MKDTYIILFMLIHAAISSAAQPAPRKVLVFYKTTSYYHESIPVAVRAIRKLGIENNFAVDTTKDAAAFNEDNLKKYAAVIFLSTSGNMLDTVQQTDFERYIQAGGGYMGIHGASAGEYNWPWYGQLVGAVFDKHPEQQVAVIKVIDKNDPSTKHLPGEWKIKDEWYNFKNIQRDIHVLLTVDESTYKGGTNGVFHPIAWYRDFEGGRSFYTAIGHRDDEYADPLYIKHLLGGIQYAMGKKSKLDYSRVKVSRMNR